MCRAKKRQQYNFITNYIIKERNNIFEVLKEKKNKAHNLEFYYQKRYPSQINVKFKKKIRDKKNEKLISVSYTIRNDKTLSSGSISEI